MRDRQPRPDNCRDCQRPLRAKGTRKVGETVEHAAKGLCSSCYKIRFYDPVVPDDTITPEQHARNVANHDAWLKERRKRGVPEEGWGVHDDEPTVVDIATRHNKTGSQRRCLARQAKALEAERTAVPA